MGQFNSSVTRVWPIFEHLFQEDPSGGRWLGELLSMGPRAPSLPDLGCLDPKLLERTRPLPSAVKRDLGQEGSLQIGTIRMAFEVELPPPAAFLDWLIRNPGELSWPRPGSRDKASGEATRQKRQKLKDGDDAVRDEALARLAELGPGKSRRAWWAFEGFTSVDCLLETPSLVLLIEGKRTDTVSSAVSWYSRRNQVVRNLEVAKAYAGRRHFAVMVCCESASPVPDDAWGESLPHLTAAERSELATHYLGEVRWEDINRRLCGGMALPNTVKDAIPLLLELAGRTPP